MAPVRMKDRHSIECDPRHLLEQAKCRYGYPSSFQIYPLPSSSPLPPLPLLPPLRPVDGPRTVQPCSTSRSRSATY